MAAAQSEANPKVYIHHGPKGAYTVSNKTYYPGGVRKTSF
jgi:hypothetical protein